MDLLITLSLLITAICAACYYFERKLYYFKDRSVPYVPGWPIFGNMASTIFQRKHFSEMMLDMYNTHPDAKYIGVFDFVRPIILLRDPELIKSITIKNFDSFQNHYSIFSKEDPLFYGNLFNMADDRWREARSILSPAFTSSKMKAMFELIVECSTNLTKYISELSEKERNMIDTKDLFARFTNDAIATCAFGIKIDSLKDPKNAFYLYGKEASTTFTSPSVLIKFFIARSCPKILQWLKIRVVREEVTNFFIDVVGKVVKMRAKKGISRPDMIQLMMDARSKNKKHLKLDIEEMTAQTFIFFLGGFDTTSTHMCILAHELAINPGVQNKLQDEIDQIMKANSGNPSYETILGMPYLDAVFNETSRRHTQAILLDRVCNKPFKLPPSLPGAKSFIIEPGMNIWISGTSIHMDPKYFDKPHKFDPERYYQKKSNINDEMNLNFGMGPRSCIGNRFAILETKILFVYLLHKYTFVPNAKTSSPLKYSKSSFNIKPDQGFWLAVEPRL